MMTLTRSVLVTLGLAAFGAAQTSPPTRAVPAPLTLVQWCASNGDCGFDISGGLPGEAAVLIAGYARARTPLPFGSRLGVQPDLIVPIGTFGADGNLQVTVPRGATEHMEAPIYVQAAGYHFADDGRPETLHCSNVLRIGPELVHAELRVSERLPAIYSVALDKWVRTTGHRLRLDRIIRSRTPNGTTRIYVRHELPNPLEAQAQLMTNIKLGVRVGTRPGKKIEVWYRTDACTVGPVRYQKVATLQIIR